jgi:hypothetical protein
MIRPEHWSFEETSFLKKLLLLKVRSFWSDSFSEGKTLRLEE